MDYIPNEGDKKEKIIKSKEKLSMKKFYGNNIKEISFIFWSVNGLKFNEISNYDNYICLLERM